MEIRDELIPDGVSVAPAALPPVQAGCGAVRVLEVHQVAGEGGELTYRQLLPSLAIAGSRAVLDRSPPAPSCEILYALHAFYYWIL